jgi:BCD family chlorophyll transporter-like MFS transporter
MDKHGQPPATHPETTQLVAKLNLATMFRLGLYQMGLGMMSILTLGVLNRVMIQELDIPARVVGVLLAIPNFVAPSRIWFGQLSDAKTLFGLHRTGYVWIGASLFAIAAFLAVQVMWQLGAAVQAAAFFSNPLAYTWTGLLALIFAGYGLALSSSSTPFAALLVDSTEEDNRSKVVGIVWSMLMVGIIFGAILAGSLLKLVENNAPLTLLQDSVNRLFVIIPIIVLVLMAIATFGVEKKYSHYASRSTIANREDQISLGKAWKILTANRQTGIFFTFLVMMTLGLFMQDPILEPFAGQIFNIPIAESTKLNAFAGVGLLIGLSLTGFLIVPRLGKRNTTQVGCGLVAVCALLVWLSGFSANPNLLRGGLLLFGCVSGISTTGAISLMLDLTAAETAGTFIGAWGLAQALARGIAVLLGTAILDAGRQLLPTDLWAYGSVFALETMVMLLAIALLRRVNVQEFQTTAQTAIASVLASELD